MLRRMYAGLCLAIVLSAGGLGGLSTPVQAQDAGGLGVQGLDDDDVAQIKQVITDWTDAFVAGNLSEWDSFWATDAVLMPPGQARIDGEGKLNAFASTPPFDDVASASFTDWDVVGRDDLAVVTNDITLMSETTGTPSVAKQVIVLRRNANGNWLIQAVMFNTHG
ncbi:MAG: DUF4440 domain-containing protein [Pseudomonadota bacterium]